MTETLAARLREIHELSCSEDGYHGNSSTTLLDAALAIEQAEATIRDLRRWKDELTDAAVVDWSLSNENKDDPKRMISDIAVNAARQAVDPAISEDAVALIAQGRAEAEATVARLTAAFREVSDADDALEIALAQAEARATAAETDG